MTQKNQPAFTSHLLKKVKQLQLTALYLKTTNPPISTQTTPCQGCAESCHAPSPLPQGILILHWSKLRLGAVWKPAIGSTGRELGSQD